MLKLIRGAALACVLAHLAGVAAAEESRPVPYFVSLAAGEVNLRTGPGVRYPIDWVYKRRALPVEVIAVFDHWRQIRDWQGTVGWVHQNMLSTRRTLIVVGEERVMRREPKSEAAPVARLAPGVVVEFGPAPAGGAKSKLPVIPGGSAARGSGAPCRRKQLSSVASVSTPHPALGILTAP